MSLCNKVYPATLRSTNIDISPNFKELEVLMTRLDKPDPTPALHWIMENMYTYVLKAYLGSWKEQQARIEADIDLLVDKFNYSVTMYADAIDWFDMCTTPGDSAPKRITIYKTGDIAVYRRLQDDAEDFECVFRHKFMDLGFGRTSIPDDDKGFLLAIIPNVRRKCLALRRCERCMERHSYDDEYYDSTVANRCNDCETYQAFKRVCRRL